MRRLVEAQAAQAPAASLDGLLVKQELAGFAKYSILALPSYFIAEFFHRCHAIIHRKITPTPLPENHRCPHLHRVLGVGWKADYNNSSNMQRRREFRVEPLKGEQLRYEGLVDRHLEYFFASKLNRQALVKTKLVNRRNEIIDRTVCRVIEGEHLQIHNSFRLKKSSSKKRYASVKSRPPSLAKTVGKKEF